MKDQSQHKLFNKNMSIDSTIPRITDFFNSGVFWLNRLAKKEKPLRFSNWAKLMKDARGEKDKQFLEKLKWLWETLSSEPDIHKTFGSRIISLDEEWKKLDSTECLPVKSRFGIFLKGFRKYGYPALPIPKVIKPDAEALILEPLYMKPGKARRLECCDVSTKLEISLPNVGSKEGEAIAFKVETDDIDIEKNCAKVSVRSLNHAYTKASLRLEPHRRSHGGRVYEHVALIDENGDFIPLEKIRDEVEKRLWSELIS